MTFVNMTENYTHFCNKCSRKKEYPDRKGEDFSAVCKLCERITDHLDIEEHDKKVMPKKEESVKSNIIKQDVTPKEEKVEMSGNIEEKPKISEGETEKLKKKSVLKPKRGKNGGARPGAGRPKGSENESTRLKREVKKKMEQRIMGVVDKLLNSQIGLADGSQTLIRIDRITKKDSKGKKTTVEKHRIVDNPTEMLDYFNGETDPNDFYYLTSKAPDNKAIDSLLDRTFGKATQKNEVGGIDGEPIKIEAPDEQISRIQEIVSKLADGDGQTTTSPSAE